MRLSARTLVIACALAGCGDDNTVVSEMPGVGISSVRSSISAEVTFNDGYGLYPHWVVALTDAEDLCTKLAGHPNYFQTAGEDFTALILWFPPGKAGTFSTGSSSNSEVVFSAVAA